MRGKFCYVCACRFNEQLHGHFCLACHAMTLGADYSLYPACAQCKSMDIIHDQCWSGLISGTPAELIANTATRQRCLQLFRQQIMAGKLVYKTFRGIPLQNAVDKLVEVAFGTGFPEDTVHPEYKFSPREYTLFLQDMHNKAHPPQQNSKEFTQYTRLECVFIASARSQPLRVHTGIS